jgi:hypothetical protein
MTDKVGRNDPCPCGSRKKYKHCCYQKGVDWNRIPDSEWARHLTVRGKNLTFTSVLLDALNLNSIESIPHDFYSFIPLLKKAVTPTAVRKIHESIPTIWPDAADLDRCYKEERQSTSGLYLGNYEFHIIGRLLNRHALYNDCILLIDPFMDPRRIAAEYNPLENPKEHITMTFHYALLWLSLLPWITEGMVRVIRSPGDFNHALRKHTWDTARSRWAQNNELKDIPIESIKPPEFEEFFKEQWALTYPDEFWIDKMKDSEGLTEEFVKKYLHAKREQSLYYVDVGRETQLLRWSSGENYEMGKVICEMTGSHIITDLELRWKEIDIDRKQNSVEINSWTPFGKAFQESKLKHLNGVSFPDLLRLRKDGYLENMRSFLRRVWNSSSRAEPFDKNNVEDLTAELHHQINEAEKEWGKIDQNLIRWFGGESVLGTAVGVSAGAAAWAPALAVAGAGAINLLLSYKERSSFITNYPAAFFLDSIRKRT